MKNLKAHFKKNGAVPRTHGNKGRLPKNTTPFVILQAALQFIVNYASRNAIPMPAAPGKSKGIPPLFLRSECTKKSVHKTYTEASDGRTVSYSLFCSLWRHCVPHIQIMSLKTDVCDTCRKFRDKISEARTEADKLKTTNDYTDHVIDAQARRDNYLKCSENCKESLKDADLLNVDTTSSTYVPPAPKSRKMKIHYTFDYAQPVTLPHLAQQIGSLFFLSLYKMQVYIFFLMLVVNHFVHFLLFL